MDFMRQIMFGVTSVELQCECGDISNRILVGRLEARLAQVLRPKYRHQHRAPRRPKP